MSEPISSPGSAGPAPNRATASACLTMEQTSIAGAAVRLSSVCVDRSWLVLPAPQPTRPIGRHDAKQRTGLPVSAYLLPSPPTHILLNAVRLTVVSLQSADPGRIRFRGAANRGASCYFHGDRHYRGDTRPRASASEPRVVPAAPVLPCRVGSSTETRSAHHCSISSAAPVTLSPLFRRGLQFVSRVARAGGAFAMPQAHCTLGRRAASYNRGRYSPC
jgi:hypothetical protein